MSIILVNTNIVSYNLKQDTRATAYAPLLTGHRLALSCVTVAELFEWANIRNWGEHRREQLVATLSTYLIISVNIDLCLVWGAIRAEQQQQGTPINIHDAWIAATAQYYTMPLVTHNPKHFSSVKNIEVRSIIKF